MTTTPTPQQHISQYWPTRLMPWQEGLWAFLNSAASGGGWAPNDALMFIGGTAPYPPPDAAENAAAFEGISPDYWGWTYPQLMEFLGEAEGIGLARLILLEGARPRSPKPAEFVSQDVREALRYAYGEHLDFYYLGSRYHYWHAWKYGSGRSLACFIPLVERLSPGNNPETMTLTHALVWVEASGIEDDMPAPGYAGTCFDRRLGPVYGDVT